ncbi:MAG: HigA family addiction module antitoxin [Bosea sp. (in: a-proteobacteria)]|uniref:HigA family addiction module antitoxin n=1 Tax=Bosea sp. (in: a-proteobacteria) TaxID=1871050 RepID=UPI002735786F|nr:HigA family addiction module antitoxin [Bosea sp. (in: a-proteobacteria)]MDP3258753.1 HigA family addiction module antitoxin [Bosea sp. (in: a-proteobacteria)]MDP3318611.1 HigA family addiction module antitoxin [Bosea sp. (in: a-proteobacteria)]
MTSKSSIIIEAVEADEAALDLIPPGEVLIEDFMKPLGVSQNRLARDIDAPVSRISGIVKGERSITADTALRLAKFFGTTPEMWMNLQTDYDLRAARRVCGADIDKRVRPLAA